MEIDREKLPAEKIETHLDGSQLPAQIRAKQGFGILLSYRSVCLREVEESPSWSNSLRRKKAAKIGRLL
jgi:hypothetical protein